MGGPIIDHHFKSKSKVLQYISEKESFEDVIKSIHEQSGQLIRRVEYRTVSTGMEISCMPPPEDCTYLPYLPLGTIPTYIGRYRIGGYDQGNWLGAF